MKPDIHIPDLIDKGRRSFRMKKLCDRLVRLSVAGKPVKLLDLSNTGLAFHGDQVMQPGRYPAQLSFELDSQQFDMSLQLNLNRIGKEYFAGEFKPLSDIDERILSRFITHCQKVLIQQAHEARLEKRRLALDAQKPEQKG